MRRLDSDERTSYWYELAGAKLFSWTSELGRLEDGRPALAVPQLSSANISARRSELLSGESGSKESTRRRKRARCVLSIDLIILRYMKND